jgi:hypothetical protein
MCAAPVLLTASSTAPANALAGINGSGLNGRASKWHLAFGVR